MLDASYYEKTDEIIACHTREERSLIPIIQDIQEEYRYLPPELFRYWKDYIKSWGLIKINTQQMISYLQ